MQKKFLKICDTCLIIFQKKELFGFACRNIGSSLIYNTSARHDQHEYNVKDMSVTPFRLEQYECDTSVT